MLLGLPFFYLLMFCGETEETDVDLMAFCGMLGVALYLIGIAKAFAGISVIAPFVVPVALSTSSTRCGSSRASACSSTSCAATGT